MMSQALLSRVASLLVLSAHTGFEEPEIEIDSHDLDSQKQTVTISCAGDRLLIDLFRDVKDYENRAMLLHGAALRHLFRPDYLASPAGYRLAIITGVAHESPPENKALGLTLIVDSTGTVSAVGEKQERAQVARLVDQIQHVAEQLATTWPKAVVKDICFISTQEMEMLQNWNRGTLGCQHQCLHDAVLKMASIYPTKTAIVSRDQCFSYRDLDFKSSLLAHGLIDRGIRPGATVPICFEKSGFVPIAMIAVMRAGAAFIPLDPGHPDERLQAILAESRSKLVITSQTQAKRIGALGVDIQVVDEDAVSYLNVHNPGSLPTVAPEDLAYVIYTSGKSGYAYDLVEKVLILSCRQYRQTQGCHDPAQRGVDECACMG
jgi:hypothetical protein